MRSKLTSILTLTLALSSPLPLAAAGFSLFEQGAKASGRAGAFAATADDPSAIFYNVAGIAYQRRMATTAGATAITFGASEFRGDPDSPYPGESRAEFEQHTFIIPNVYVIYPVGENVTLGFGQFTPFGLRSDWAEPNSYPGRFISQDANLKTVSLQPSAAWKTDDGRFAVGAGIEYRTSHLSLERNQARFNPFTQRIADVAHVRLNSDWNDGIGWNLGLMFRPSERWSFGASYRANIEIDYEGDAKFTQIMTGNPQFDAAVGAALPPNQDISTTIDFPSFMHLGVATTVIPEWTVEFNAVQMGWSSFDRLLVEFAETPENNLNVVENWDDAWSFRLGGERPVTDRWTVLLGAVYDQTPQPIEVMGPLLPDADRYGVTIGLSYERGPWTVDVSNMALFFEERGTEGRNHDNFNGTYETNANLLSVNLGYTF